ncbi:hypothetical protein [Crossiella sp. NPDC003009]
MGHRANFVLVEPDGDWSLRYSHWAANTLDTDLLPGPEHAVRLVRAQQPTEEWLDQRWGEGGLLLDLRRRVVLFFSWHLRELPLRAAVFAVLARTWPGWQVRWAYRGMAELRGWVGLPPGQQPPEPPEELSADPEFAFDSLVSVRMAEGIRAYSVDPEDDALAWLGPRLLDLLPAEGLVRSGEYLPGSGLHLDLVGRELGLWTTGTLPGEVDELAARWPGWRVRFWADRFAEQFGRIGHAVRLPPVDLAAGLTELEARFRRGLDADPVASFRSGMALLAEQGRRLEVSAATAAHGLVRPSPAEVEAVLAELRPGG